MSDLIVEYILLFCELLLRVIFLMQGQDYSLEPLLQLDSNEWITMTTARNEKYRCKLPKHLDHSGVRKDYAIDNI